MHGLPRGNFAEIFDNRKLVPGLLYDVVCVILGLVSLIELRLVTYRQTDGRTDNDDSIYCANIASRGKTVITVYLDRI